MENLASLKEVEPLMGDVAILAASPSTRAMWRYRRDTGAAWYNGAIILFLAVTVAVAAIATGTVLVFPNLDSMHPMGRLGLALVPLIWSLMLISGYVWWFIWRVRDVRLQQYATYNGLSFRDRAPRRFRQLQRSGTGFPRSMQNLERSTFGLEDWAVIGRNQPVQKKNADRVSLRKPFLFAELTLPREVPQIVLKNKRARILPLTGLGLGNRIHLSLEGDFDRYFTLLCPAGYERDALEIFTPDVMAAVIDLAGNAEVELVDDKLYLYMKVGTPIWKPAVMDRLQRTLTLLLQRFHHQTRGYTDDRNVTAGSVALGGRRMTDASGVSAMTYVAAASTFLLSGVMTALTLFVFPYLS